MSLFREQVYFIFSRMELQCFEDSQITVELEAETEYQVFIDGASTGTMTTNLGGKLSFSVELDANTKAEVKIVKC